MKVVRQGVFETNSSSSHSLVIRKKSVIVGNTYFTTEEMKNSLYSVKNGVYNSGDKDWYFGRHPFRVLSTFEEKFKYAYACFNYNEDKKHDLMNLFYELIPSVTSIQEPTYAGTDDSMLSSWLESLNITLKEFLTNKKYIIICDGDEYCIWDRLRKVGIIDKDAIERNLDFDEYQDDMDEDW